MSYSTTDDGAFLFGFACGIVLAIAMWLIVDVDVSPTISAEAHAVCTPYQGLVKFEIVSTLWEGQKQRGAAYCRDGKVIKFSAPASE